MHRESPLPSPGPCPALPYPNEILGLSSTRAGRNPSSSRGREERTTDSFGRDMVITRVFSENSISEATRSVRGDGCLLTRRRGACLCPHGQVHRVGDGAGGAPGSTASSLDDIIRKSSASHREVCISQQQKPVFPAFHLPQQRHCTADERIAKFLKFLQSLRLQSALSAALMDIQDQASRRLGAARDRTGATRHGTARTGVGERRGK